MHEPTGRGAFPAPGAASPGRTLAVTCCAADKDPGPGEMPALSRYRSTRIAAVAALADRRGWDFRILSGRYGLLAAGTPIPWYDHLLRADEVAGHARRVAGQLADLAPAGVIVFTRTAADDPGAGPYLACCREACALAGVACRTVELPAGPLAPADLEVL